MTTLEVNTSKKNLFTELFSKENRLLLHKHIINKLKLSDISKESKKNILNILQKNMKANYDKLKIDSSTNIKSISDKFNNESIEKTLNELNFLRSLIDNFNKDSFETEPEQIIMAKLFSNSNHSLIYKEVLNILNLNDKSDNVKSKVLEVLKKKMQLISSKLQPNMINQTNFESILNQFNKMSIKETVDQVSNQKSGIIEPNASKLKFERDFNSVPNQGNKLMDRPLATAANKNLEKFLYPPGFERESKNSIPDPKFDKLFKPIVDNVDDNYQFNKYQHGRGTEEFGNSFEKLMSERDMESAIPRRPATPDFLKSVNTSSKGPPEFKTDSKRPEVTRKGGKPNFSQSIPESELDTGFLSANDNNDLYDIDNIDKPVEKLEFEEDSRSFEQRLKSLERDRGSVSTQLVSINNEPDSMENLQPKTIEEIKRERDEKERQEQDEKERELREKYKEQEFQKYVQRQKEEEKKLKKNAVYSDHLKYLEKDDDDSDESPKPKVDMQKIHDALKRLGIEKPNLPDVNLKKIKKENKLLKKKLNETSSFDLVKKEIGSEFSKLNEKELEINKKETEMKVLLKKYSYLYGLKHVQMDISPQTPTSKYVFNFNRIGNIHGIKLMSYSIPTPRYNIEEDKNNIFKIKSNEETIEIKLNSGKYKIDDLLGVLNKKSNLKFDLNYEEKVEIKGENEFEIIPTPLSMEVLGFTETSSELANEYIANKTWDLRVEDKVYLFINNVEESVPFAVLYTGNQAVQQFKFDEPIELDNLEIEFKDSKGRAFNFYGLTYSINVQLELSESMETNL
jgi:hypothetical protein